MRGWRVYIRNTETGIQRTEEMRAEHAADVREAVAPTLAATETIEEVRWMA